MKQISIISGKGGTGKTVLTASFAALGKNKVMVDCDVDAADLYLLLNGRVKETREFKSGVTARIDKKRCKKCGKCIRICRFNAIDEDFNIDPVSCEGCTICSYVCPADAIKLEENLSGELFISETKYGPFVHAKLGIAEENSGKLVTEVRKVATDIAEREKLNYIIIDGPPGVGCPVIASLTGVNTAVVVTEPTVSGIHDMRRVIEVASHFDLDTKVVINKYDLNLVNTNAIKSECDEKNIEVAGMIPFSKEVSKSIVKSLPFVEYIENDVSKEIKSIWDKIC